LSFRICKNLDFLFDSSADYKNFKEEGIKVAIFILLLKISNQKLLLKYFKNIDNLQEQHFLKYLEIFPYCHQRILQQ
jgi:hypothetical protein